MTPLDTPPFCTTVPSETNNSPGRKKEPAMTSTNTCIQGVSEQKETGAENKPKEVHRGGPEVNIWKTEIILNSRGRGLPFDSDRMHRILTHATNSPDYLWSHPRPGVLLVQSTTPIPPEVLHGEASSVRAKCVPLDYQEGDRVEIASIVCPTKAQPREGRHSRKIPLPIDQVPAWLTRTLAGAATLDTITVEPMSPSQGRRPDGTRIIHTRVAIHCWATVTNPDTLAGLALTGVGPGKRFGCGMLTIRTTREEAA